MTDERKEGDADDPLLVGNFVKLYGSIVTSSVWGESSPTRIVWLTMLAIADATGGVAGSIPGLARIANVTVPECEAALVVLQAPDQYSRTEDHDGRRIRRVNGGWMVLNYKLYRELRTPKQVKEAERKADYRERQRSDTDTERDTPGQSRLSHTEVEVEVEEETTTTHSLSPAREEGWPTDVHAFADAQGNTAAWYAAFNAMLNGVGTPGGKTVTPEQIAQACVEIGQLGGEISPRRFRRVLQQVMEPDLPRTERAGKDDTATVDASRFLRKLIDHRDPLHPHTLTAEGWKRVTFEQREAIKSIGGVARVLNSKPEHWMFTVRDYVTALRGSK